jgi:hypothetical protein
MLDRRDAAEEVMSRYRDPLLRSIIDLQGRIYSIVKLNFMQRHLGSGDPEQVEYARVSTLFRLADYFGWVEILRVGVQFLNLGDRDRSRELAALSQEISLAFANTHKFPDAAFRLFRDEQRAIGELVVEQIMGEQRAYQCIGYAQFVQRLENDPSFSRWFSRLSAEMDSMISPSGNYLDRLIEVHDLFGTLLEFLDPSGVRYPTFEYSRTIAEEKSNANLSASLINHLPSPISRCIIRNCRIRPQKLLAAPIRQLLIGLATVRPTGSVALRDS